MLPGQMLLRQLKSVQNSPRNLHLKFRQNRVSFSFLACLEVARLVRLARLAGLVRLVRLG